MGVFCGDGFAPEERRRDFSQGEKEYLIKFDCAKLSAKIETIITPKLTNYHAINLEDFSTLS